MTFDEILAFSKERHADFNRAEAFFITNDFTNPSPATAEYIIAELALARLRYNLSTRLSVPFFFIYHRRVRGAAIKNANAALTLWLVVADYYGMKRNPMDSLI